MKIFKYFLLAAVLMGCSPKIVPTKTEVIVRDSIILHTDTVAVPIPYEVIREVVPLMDTLKMETSVAYSRSWVDTSTLSLKGELNNKPISLEKEIQWKEKVRDSLVYQDVPVPVEVEKVVVKVPWWARALSTVGVVAIVFLILLLGVKFAARK